MQCPAAFHYKRILRIPDYSTIHTVRGNIVHAALEALFTLPPEERTPEAVLPVIYSDWAVRREEPGNAHLIDGGPLAIDEAEMLASCEQMVRNYFQMERYQNFTPTGIEMNVAGEMGTGDDAVKIMGIIDRLDRHETPNGDVHWTISDYKGLALDTPLPTPAGWTTMGDVAVGDELMGADGRPTRVTVKSEVHHRPCYRVEFDDASSIVCDNVHLWQVERNNGRHHTGAWVPEVLEAREIARAIAEEGAQYRIPNAAPLALPDVDLPLDPYALGARLGNGASQGGPVITGPDDRDHLLDDLGVRKNKHIPSAYLRGSIEQRTQLLQGLMDAAGSWDAGRQQAIFATITKNLADGVAELVQSLGGRSGTFACSDDSVRDHRTTYQVMFSPLDFEAFTLPRTTPEFVANATRPQHRIITAMVDIPSVPTQCVKVDAPDSLYLAGRQMVPTHNTGKTPSPRYIDETFFAMRVYAALFEDMTGARPSALRLIYVKTGDRDNGIIRDEITPQKLTAARRKVVKTWSDIRQQNESGIWPTKTGPLCNWCRFQPICPAFANQGLTIPPDLADWAAKLDASDRDTTVDEDAEPLSFEPIVGIPQIVKAPPPVEGPDPFDLGALQISDTPAANEPAETAAPANETSDHDPFDLDTPVPS